MLKNNVIVSAFVVLAMTAPYTVHIFNSDPEVVSSYTLYFIAAGSGYPMLGLTQVVASAFNARGKPLPSMILAVSRMFVFLIPLALLGAFFFVLPGIFASIALTNTATGLASLIWMRSANKN